MLLTQLATNTGLALLRFQFNVQYQIGGGLPLQGTLFPNFIVTGTVQPAFGSYASVAGFIDYYATNTAGTIGVVETVNYNQTFLTPGPITAATVPGVPVFGNTPALVGGTTLTLVGDISFIVDPANVSIHSVAAPEPSAGLLAVFSSLPLLLRRIISACPVIKKWPCRSCIASLDFRKAPFASHWKESASKVTVAPGPRPGTGRSADSFRPALRDPAGQLRGLPDPTRHQLLVELVGLADVEVAHFPLPRLAGGDRTQRRAAEESHLDGLR